MNFKPHNYQEYAVNYIKNNDVAAILLGMGLGKTVISLSTIADLLFDSFDVHKVLVIGPLRVARNSWPMEIAKWEHLNHLTYAVAIGTLQDRKNKKTKMPTSQSSTEKMWTGLSRADILILTWW